MSKAFENFMAEYQEKQTGCYGPGEPSADDPIQDNPQTRDGAGPQVATGKEQAVPIFPGIPFMTPSESRASEALILAQSCVLLSRSLAYVGLQDLKCARELAVEIRDQLDAINAYALSRGIGMDLANAMLYLMSGTGDFAVSGVSA